MGYVEMMVSVGNRKEIQKVNSQFLVVPRRSVYKFILGRLFAATLDAIASPLHLKLKYHIL